MLTEEKLLMAMSGVRPEDVLAAGRAMGYLPRQARKNYWRPLLIAAVLTALLAATVVAAGLLGRADRLAPMPPDESGEAQQAEIPNGFRGTPTYQGSAAWWEFMANWALDQGPEPENYNMDFIQGDLDRYLVCSLYGAFDRQQAETLYAIAEEYDLQLYREAVYFGPEPEEFHRLTGVPSFLPSRELGNWSGYVLEDGSFSAEIRMRRGSQTIGGTLRRYYTGSIYPFGGADRLRPYEESQYVTAQGYSVYLDIFRDGGGEITYCDPQGETYITFAVYGSPGNDLPGYLQLAADQLDFGALCQRDTAQVLAILDRPTGAEKNPEAVRRLKAFQNSPVFRAGKEFQSFYEENFYGSCFTGTYGLPGCGDIDRELTDLGKTYGLTVAREKTQGNDFSSRAIVFDNGAWQMGIRGAKALHYIPKDALYTMQQGFLDARAYRRIWEYETEEGQSLVLCTQGPVRSDFAGGYALWETEDAYVLLTFRGASPMWMEQRAEQLDWSLFDSQEGSR